LGVISLLVVLTLSPLVPAQWGQPDLVVKKIQLYPAEPEPGDLVKIAAVIANEGPGDARQGFDVRFKVDDLSISQQRVTRLKSGETVAVGAQWQAVEGEHQVSVDADEPFGRVRESNERNNSLQISVDVHRKAAVYSITEEIMLAVGKSLQTTAEMFRFTVGDDLFAAMDDAIGRLEQARFPLETAAWELVQLKENLPPPLSRDAVITSGQAIGEAFGEMAVSLGTAASALRNLNVEAAATAVEEIEAELNELARLSFDGVQLERLAEAAGYIDQAAQAALALQDVLLGTDSGSEGTLDESVAELLAILGKAGDVLGSVGAQIESLVAHRGIIFTDDRGQPLITYDSGETLLIQVYGARFVIFEVYDSEGSSVAERVAIDDRLQWEGGSDPGSLLPTGEYFYRLRTDRGAGEERDIGRILIS
jgi:hypothetical protein